MQTLVRETWVRFKAFAGQKWWAFGFSLLISPSLVLAGCGSSAASPSSAPIQSSLAVATPTPETTLEPTPAPPEWPPLTVTFSCTKNNGASYVIAGGAAPFLGIEIASKPDFSDIPYGGPKQLDAATYTYSSSIMVSQFPDGIYVRWSQAPQITAHGDTSGPCGMPDNAQVQLTAACTNGTPIPGAAPIGGSTHPDIEGSSGVDESGWVFKTGLQSSWETFQLLICEHTDAYVPGVACGTYYSDDLSRHINVSLMKGSETVRVLEASTGKTLHAKTFYGHEVCPPSVYVPFDGSPTMTVNDSASTTDTDPWIQSFTKIKG